MHGASKGVYWQGPELLGEGRSKMPKRGDSRFPPGPVIPWAAIRPDSGMGYILVDALGLPLESGLHLADNLRHACYRMFKEPTFDFNAQDAVRKHLIGHDR